MLRGWKVGPVGREQLQLLHLCGWKQNFGLNFFCHPRNYRPPEEFREGEFFFREEEMERKEGIEDFGEQKLKHLSI